MTKILFRLPAILLIACALCSIASGQDVGSRAGTLDRELENESEAQQKRVRAINLIEVVAEEAGHWEGKREAIRVLADAADLLWHNNPDKGRKWLRRAWSLVEQIHEDSAPNTSLSDFFQQSVRSGFYNSVLQVAARHDQKLFEELLKDLEKQTTEGAKPRGAFDDRTSRSEQLLRLAQQALRSNPELASALAARSLNDGVSPSLQHVLAGLRRTRPELANQLFDLALSTLSRRDADPIEAEVLAGYLFRPGFTFSTNASHQVILVVNPAEQNSAPVASAEAERAKNFLVLVHRVFLLRPVSDYKEQRRLLVQTSLLVDGLLDQYRIYAPDLLPSVLGLLAQMRRKAELDAANAQTSGGRSSSSVRVSNINEDYEARLRRLEEVADKERDPIAKKLAYATASLAVKIEDHERARGIAAKISEKELRRDVISFLTYRAALFHLKNGEIDRADSLAKEIDDPLRRAVARIALAQLILSSAKKLPGEHRILHQQRALDQVTDIERELRSFASTSSAKILLARTAVLSRLDQIQAMASLESAIQVINKLEHFDLGDDTPPDLSLRLSPSSHATLYRPQGFDFSSAIGLLAVSDFEQVVGMAGRFVRKELSGVGRIEAARTYLSRLALSGSQKAASKQSSGPQL